ncbi:TMhelix containing protein [Vibrio phage 1.020.O._10N.222.48.A2]|uniref:TMhelix containing protein n=1 Tax=Vibrio phage 1.020.O._10N.222.48.A2 TaxID=1881450 RepID=A0A2I7QKZ7_9VIRU|nr:TMhelix containing protein [Vibrio phage 1.020.O._10N.222.48.A2]AUR82059.1 TMhelix containing protein [Vibrio phage 1.020.O._10N.222.48.A2]
MSFSRGGSSKSATTNEQNPITATDNAMVASEGGTITVTDGGAFGLVGDAVDAVTKTFSDMIFSNEKVIGSSIDAVTAATSDAIFSNEKVVGDAMLTNESIANSAIDAGLEYQKGSNNVITDTLERVFDFVGDTVTKSQDTISSSATALFDSAKSDELNKSQDMQQTIRTLAMYAAVGSVAFITIKYAFK